MDLPGQSQEHKKLSTDVWHGIKRPHGVQNIPIVLDGFEVRALCRSLKVCCTNLDESCLFLNIILSTGKLEHVWAF